jgi:hypothetical protein
MVHTTLFHNVPISQKLSATSELGSWLGRRKQEDSLFHNLLLKTVFFI